MAINFNELPDNKASSTVEKGTYIATIEKAEMKQGADLDKPMYLNLTLKLSDVDGKDCGKVYDIIAESAHELVRYKLKRFIQATEIPIVGSFELKDLVKIVPNKKIIVCVTVEEKDGKPPRAIVDIFAEGVYYPISQKNEVFGIVPKAPKAVINAPDAIDTEDTPFASDPEPTPTEEY
jgi:hypothetical protein